MIGGIYLIRNIINNKLYIGSSINIKKRFIDHKNSLLSNKHHSIKLQRAFNKYGIDNFKFEIIEEAKNEFLIEREQFYLNKLIFANCDDDRFNVLGYNISRIAGNTLGIKRSEETKRKMSESKKGQNTWSKGRKNTEETIKKMSDAHKGKQLTTETKIKISNKLLNKKVNEKTKEKQRLKKIGINNPNYIQRSILQFNTNGIFIKEWFDLVSIKEAGIPTNNITAVCNNIRKSAAGFKWKWK